MALDSERQIIKEGDTEKDQFVVKFSNGALKQLEELKDFFSLTDEEEVVKAAISLMQSLKNRSPKTEDRHPPIN